MYKGGEPSLWDTFSLRNTVGKAITFGIQQVGEPPTYGIHTHTEI